MNSNYQKRFVLIDFGYPMNGNTIQNIIKSLENILLLSLAFSQNQNETNFKISVLSSHFAIIHFEPDSWSNYEFVAKNLNYFLKTTKGKVTVQDFKNLLNNSIETILCEIQKKYTAGKTVNEHLMQIAVVSKKTAWILADILSGFVRSKPHILSTENFKIVQIVNETQRENEEKNSLIDCTFCSDEPQDLNSFFKNWLLNSQQQLRLIISGDANLELKCEVEDCLINPSEFCSKFDLFDDVRIKRRNTMIDSATQVCKLEVTHRLPVNGLCPTLIFGTPRRVKASSWTKTDSRLFKQLCRELNRTGEGLLAKSVTSTDLTTFHFLTSDGDMILMNEVASSELHLPKRGEFSELSEDEHLASKIRDHLQKVKYLGDFKPENFSSGVIQLLRQHFHRKEQNESVSPLIDSQVPQNENPTNSKSDNKAKEAKSDRKKRRKGSEKQLENVHPALLSPTAVEKYRKIDKHAFVLPELGKKFL